MADYPDTVYQRPTDQEWVEHLAKSFCTQGIKRDKFAIDISIEEESDIVRDGNFGIPSEAALAAGHVKVLNGMHRIQAIGKARELAESSFARLFANIDGESLDAFFQPTFLARIYLSNNVNIVPNFRIPSD